MSPRDFIRTLYLGDRACKAILIDGWNGNVKVQVDRISRVRSASGTWDFYTDEDVIDGFLVFDGVETLELVNSGHLPNDLINSVKVLEEHSEHVIIELSIDSVKSDASRHEALLRITCKSIHIEDPARPGLHICS
jgi:hypothetical protein